MGRRWGEAPAVLASKGQWEALCMVLRNPLESIRPEFRSHVHSSTNWLCNQGQV